MRNRLLHNWYIYIITAGIFCFSVICWLLFFLDILKADHGNRENKNVNFVGSIEYFMDTIDDTWYDNIFLKTRFNALHSSYMYLSTKEIDSNQVIIGKDDWLFYKDNIDGDTIADFEGTNRYGKNELNEMLKTVRYIQGKMEDRGVKFAILVPPNKENIYSEFMPDIYSYNPLSSTDIMVDYLRSNGISILSPKDGLMRYHSDIQLYYSYDSHWNQLGGYIGVKTLMDFWNIPLQEIDEKRILSYPLKGKYHYGAMDDLAQMSGLIAILNDELEYEIEGTRLIDWQRYEKEQNAKEISYFKNTEARLSETVFLIGDSFRTAMIPALCQIFQNVYIVDRSNYSASMLEELNPDYLVVEYVERYSRQISEIDFLLN